MSDSPSDRPDAGRTAELVRAAEPETRSLSGADDHRDRLPGLEPEREVSDWGRSERVTALADGTLMDFLYHYWFRVEVEGIGHVPLEGGALLVANRAGRLPADGAMIAKAVAQEHARGRLVHIAATRSFAGVPGLGMAVTKLGAVGAHPANLHRLLFDEQELVLVFPEGSRGLGKPVRWRYRLRSFDGIGFVEAALRARVPIVPVAVLGAEEAMPTLGSLPGLRRLRLPITTAVPFPAKFRLRFLRPVPAEALAEAASVDPGVMQDLAEDVRALLQENLLDMVAHRRSVWLG